MNFDIKHLSRIPLLLAFLICTTAFAQPGGYFPPPSAVIFHGDTLTIYPPDSLPAEPVEMIAYNIFVDSVFFDNVTVTDPAEPVDYIPDLDLILPGNRSFCAKAVYNEWISESACDTAQVFYGMELPVLEDWSSGSFETLQWTTGSENWIIDVDEGNPLPSAAFLGNPAVTDYEIALESYPVTALGMSNGKIWLDFDIKLDAIQATGTEKLTVQVWNWVTNTWTTCASYDNSGGSFEVLTEHINIKSLSMNKVFMVRFLAAGENSMEIGSWNLDNIHIYRNCDHPTDLTLTEYPDYNLLEWIGLGWIMPSWYLWCDNLWSGTSIGTGESVEFDVAARWLPNHLTGLNGKQICNFAYIPCEYSASYSIRIWQGDGPDTLLLNQPVSNFQIGEWNFIALDTPVIIDASKQLWVGYHINANYGYPAGVDDGPALDGLGNMIYFQDKWSTLLDINPDLDYNWNIAFEIETQQTDRNFYNIYRQTNGGNFDFLEISYHPDFTDTNISISDHYCYEVTYVDWSGTDTCESQPTNIACETITGLSQQDVDSLKMKIYPNPAVNHLFIESRDEIREVRLYNSLGELEKKLEVGNSKFGLDCSGLVDGIYLIEIKTRNLDYKSKVLIIE